jgi:hypothetical protein
MAHQEPRASHAESTREPGERAVYVSPTLRRLGSVRELTLTGGASNTDGGGLGGAKKPRA